MKLPEARNRQIVITELEKELLIYDLAINKAYCLNATSANVYNACGKRQSFADLKREHHYTDDLIHFALGELRANDLIEGTAEDYFSGLTRREVVKRIGLSSMIALPVISSLVAPSAAQAASRTTCVNPGGMAAGSLMYNCGTFRYGLCQAGCAGNPNGLRNCCSNTADIDPKTCPPGTNPDTTGCRCICT